MFVPPPFASADSGPSAIAGLVALVLVYWLPYWRRARTLAGGQQRPVPRWRQLCYGAGLIVLVGALSPPVGRISDQLFAAHMLEHLLIGDVAALLLVLGLTGPLLAPLLRVRALDRLRALSHPLIAVPLWAINLYLWHLPVLYQAALRHDAIHVLEHVCFLVFGILMWLPLFGPLPKPAWFGNLARLGYIVVVRLIGTVLANVFVWSGTLFYGYYLRGDAHWHITPLSDQSLAGSLMMIEESLLTIGLFCWLFLRAAREAEERQQLVELAAARGIELTDVRAARAVAAGRGEELRQRVLES